MAGEVAPELHAEHSGGHDPRPLPWQWSAAVTMRRDTRENDEMILIAYDGSADSQSAVQRAAELMPDQPATVLTVWEPFDDIMARAGAGMLSWPEQGMLDEIDAASMDSARTRAEQGAEHARRAGLHPQVRVGMRGATVAETILVAADEVEANVIVLGTRGLSGLKSLLLGSVSHAVLQHASRPVLVVPSPEVAARRAAGPH